MEAFLASLPLILIAEMGDKTQLLALALSTRFKRATPIIAGITLATLLNHAASAWLGQFMAGQLGSALFERGIAISFIVLGLWMLKADEAPETPKKLWKLGPFLATLIAFSIAEIGDKTQLATVSLAATYHSVFWVTLGTTTGMLLANIPIVFLGKKLLSRLPMERLHVIAALLFIFFGALQLYSSFQ